MSLPIILPLLIPLIGAVVLLGGSRSPRFQKTGTVGIASLLMAPE